jgi:hypothetical protein
LSGDKLVTMRVDMYENNDAWLYSHRGAKGSHEIEDDARIEGASSQALVPTDAVGPVTLPELADFDSLDDVRRAVAHVGGASPRVKIYADRSHTSGVQRIWSECSAHGCARYKFAFGDVDKRF